MGALHLVPRTRSTTAGTTTTLASDTPDPSVVGQAVTVAYTVTANPPGSGTPTGNVTVSDGVNNCTGTVAAGSCSLTLTTAGARTLTATYAGDANFNGSSGTASHTVLFQYLLSVSISGSGTVTREQDRHRGQRHQLRVGLFRDLQSGDGRDSQCDSGKRLEIQRLVRRSGLHRRAGNGERSPELHSHFILNDASSFRRQRETATSR